MYTSTQLRNKTIKHVQKIPNHQARKCTSEQLHKLHGVVLNGDFW